MTAMRVAIVGSEAEDNLEFHLRDTLARAGAQARCFDERDTPMSVRPAGLARAERLVRRIAPSWDRAILRRIADRVSDFDPDLVLVTPRDLDPALVRRIRERRPSAPIVQMNPDSLLTLGRGRLFLGGYDLYLTKDRFIERALRDKLGFPVRYLPEAFNPAYHVPPDAPKGDVERAVDVDVAVFGSMYPYRTVFLERLLDAGVRFSLFGARPSHATPGRWEAAFTGEYLRGRRKAEVLRGARIALNIMHYAEIESVNARFFEILGCGGFQLCDRTPVLAELAHPGQETETFATFDEAVDKIRAYLADAPARAVIADAGRRRALAEHTYEHRFAAIFGMLGMTPPPGLRCAAPAVEPRTDLGAEPSAARRDP